MNNYLLTISLTSSIVLTFILKNLSYNFHQFSSLQIQFHNPPKDVDNDNASKE
jgi:hypothetical protein